MSDTNHLVSSESASGEEPVASMTAPYPFDEPSADVILRTSDNVDFHVRKAILEEASSMFATMFSLPQPPIGSEQGPQDSSPAIVPVSEPSEVMDPLLRMCYPAVPPTLSTLEEVAPLLKAADKYQMHDLLAVLTDKWAVLAEFNSLKAYMFAIIYDLEDPARVAAKHSLRDISLCEYRDTLLANISFGSISALVMYREDCARAADKAAKEFAREKKSFTVRTTCPHSNLDNHKRLMWMIGQIQVCDARKYTLTPEDYGCKRCGKRSLDVVKSAREFNVRLKQAIEESVSKVVLDFRLDWGQMWGQMNYYFSMH